MEVTLVFHSDLSKCSDLVPELDVHVRRAHAELTDRVPAEGVGQRLLERAHGAPEGLILTAHRAAAEEGPGERLGYCIVAPMVDPMTGESMPIIAALEVSGEFRRRGLARSMVQAVIEELKKLGIGEVAARTGYTDDALISMGERWGFVRAYEILFRE